MSGTPYFIGTGSEASGGSGVITITTTITTSPGDSIMVAVGSTGVVNDPSSVTDSQGNSYNEIEGPTGTTSVSGSIWQADGCSVLTSGIDTITITLPGTAPTVAIVVGDNNVGQTVTPEDQNVSATGVSTAAASGSSGTLNQTYEHAIGFTVDLAAGGVPSWASPWSSHVLGNVEDSGSAVRISAAYQDVTATTALDATATITSTSWTCMLATNKVTNLQITNANLPNGVINLAYSVPLSTIGGVGTVTFSLSSGTLPPGLSISGSNITGTPTAVGTYDFTIGAAASSFGPSTTQTYSVTILQQQVSGAPQPSSYSNNILSQADASGSTGFTWAALTNASSVGLSNRQALSGANAFTWTATATSSFTAIHTGNYPVQPNKSYVVSGAMLPLGGQRNLYIGIQWLNAAKSPIFVSGGPNAIVPEPTVSQGSYWTPTLCLGTSPPTAAFAQIVAWVQGATGTSVLAGEQVFLDQVFFLQSNIQISIDFQNPPFTSPNIVGVQAAGTAFLDVTPWVRQDMGVNYTRGRQDAISEVQAGSSNFSLQNDQGIFTCFNDTSFLNFMGPSGAAPTLSQRFQVNFSDELGNWYTRLDGQISEINYTFDNTGNTSVAAFSGTDLLAYMNRQPSLLCWTYQTILADNPVYFWPLNDYDETESIVSFDQNILEQTVDIATSGYSLASEVAGFNGPPMRLSDISFTENSGIGINWADTTYGVETLADAVEPGQPDGSAFWAAGTDQPTSATRGLASGNVGPFTTPLPDILFTPNITPGTSKNNWVNNQGFQLVGSLNPSQALQTSDNSYTIEIYFMSAPELVTSVSSQADSPFWAQNLGPFIALGIGNSRDLNNIAAGIFIGSNTATFAVNTYTNPPAWGIRSFSSATPIGPSATISQSYTPDSNGCPHHLAICLQSSSSGTSTLTAFLDGVQMSGSITLPSMQVYDTISVGGPHGGSGNWYGSISCCAVYDYVLSAAQINEHCQRGQYGNWEMATDQCISELTEYAVIPPYWDNITASDTVGNSSALSLTEYLDITGTGVLSNMTSFEQTENGLIFINAAGQLTFLTRDWKMGHGGPDLYLPGDTFDGTSIGYELVDQFMVNEMAVSSIVFPTGGTWVNQDSINQYGVYSTNPIGSPYQLPILSFNRAFAQLGLPSFTYYTDPYIIDMCSWMATTRSQPYFTAASVTVDVLAIDSQSGLSLSDFYNLEIGDMIAPSGTMPASFPTSQFSTNWFIEGITEAYSISAHTIQYFTSPAETQVAWIPGDPIYGVLGDTTVLGISATDTNSTEADGKDVSHDAGPPYWPPNFVDNIYYDDTIQLLPSAYYPLTGTTAADLSGSGFNATPVNSSCCLFSYNSSPIAGSGDCVQMFAAGQGGLVTTYAPSGGSQWTMECWVNLNNMPQITALNPNPRVFASSHTIIDNCGFEIYLTGGNTPTFSIGNGTTHATIESTSAIGSSGWHSLILTWDGSFADTVTAYVDFVEVGSATFSGTLGNSTGHVTMGAGTYNGDFLNGLIGQCAIYPQALSSVSQRQTDAQTPGMNNPAGDGNFFVGNNDMRGIVWPLQQMLTPPMCVVGQQTQTVKYAEGALPDPSLPFDTVYVDTEGSMGLLASWPNWYVVTVPGFYEIDADVEVAVNENNDSAQAWIIVAEEGAQKLQGGLGSPTSNLQYVCPVGEAKRLTNGTGPGNSVNMCPSWRGYLGVGDMIAVGFEHNVASVNVPTANANGGSWLSIRWTGVSNTGDDRAQVCSLINGGTIVNPGEIIPLSTGVWTNTGCYSYVSQLPKSGTIYTANTNKQAWQGNNNPPSGRMQYSQIPFNFTSINNTLNGADIETATLTFTNLGVHSGQTQTIAMLGLYYGNTGKSPWNPIFSGGGKDAIGSLTTPAVQKGQTIVLSLPSTFFGAVGGQGDVATVVNGASCSGIVLGNDQFTSSQYNGYFNGKPGSWILTVQYRI